MLVGKASLGVRLNLEAGWIRLVQVDNSGHHRVHEESWGSSKPSSGISEKLSAGGAEVVLGLPEEAVHTRYLEFPNLKKGQWETAVRSTAMRYFPFQASRHTLAHSLCPALSGERKRSGAVAFLIDQATLRNQTEWLQSRGCKVDHVEFESLAVQRWLCWEEASMKKGAFLWCRLGDKSLQVGLVVDRLYYGCQALTPP